MPRWLPPTIAYVLVVGTLGVTSKLALDDLVWQDLLLWVGIGYILSAIVVMALGQARARRDPGTRWAIISAAVAVCGIVSLYHALGSGEASKVIPVSASYPVVTLVLSALILRERITRRKVGGMALVVTGVVLLTVAH
jgi:transporter family protein